MFLAAFLCDWSSSQFEEDNQRDFPCEYSYDFSCYNNNKNHMTSWASFLPETWEDFWDPRGWSVLRLIWGGRLGRVEMVFSVMTCWTNGPPTFLFCPSSSCHGHPAILLIDFFNRGNCIGQNCYWSKPVNFWKLQRKCLEKNILWVTPWWPLDCRQSIKC